MHICVVITSLRAGGAERVVTTLSNEWVRASEKVTIVTLAPVREDFYDLDARVIRVSLGLTGDSGNPLRAAAANAGRIWALRRAIQGISPDVVVSFIDTTNVITLIAAIGLGIPVAVSERSDPRQMPLGRTWEAMRRLTYPRSTQLIVQTRAVEAWAHETIGTHATVVLPNPLTKQFSGTGLTPRPAERVKRIVGLGRLVHEKGFDVLIDAFARASRSNSMWSLAIAGAGPLEDSLKRRARECGAGGRIEFPGLIREPERLLASSEIFVLSSRCEGFPNALVEAMACGCAVVATDCQSGPAEILVHGRDGVLVPVDDAGELADVLGGLMSDDRHRRRLGEAAMTSARRFLAPDIARRWLDRLAEAAQSHASGRSEDSTPLCASE